MEKSNLDIPLNISSCVPWKKENHTDLVKHEGEEMVTESSFLNSHSLK